MHTRRLPPRIAALFPIAALLVGIGCDSTPAPKPDPTASAAAAVSANTPADTSTDKPGQSADAGDSGNYELDVSHSTIVFSAKHAGLSWTYGSINKVTGKLVLDADAAKSTVEIEADADSLFSADKKRDEHLKGPDFLNTKQFPTITFKSTAVKASGDDAFDVTGDLTLHGVTRSVTVPMTKVGSGEFPMDKSFRIGFEGNLTVKRSDYEMKNMMEVVGDEIRLVIAIEAVRK